MRIYHGNRPRWIGLRARRERPCGCCAAERGNEFSPCDVNNNGLPFGAGLVGGAFATPASLLSGCHLFRSQAEF